MTLVSPESWYRLFWIAMGTGFGVLFLLGLYWVVKYAIIGAWIWLRQHLPPDR